MNLLRLTALALLSYAGAAGALTADEVKQLGSTLTPCGAVMAGSPDGMIPAYAGGLSPDTKPPGWDKSSGRYSSPYPDDKPLFTITSKNVSQYTDRLTEGQKELFKVFPEYRMIVYPTRRSVRLPQYVQDGCLKNAVGAKLSASGLTLESVQGPIPFPIPKNGLEVVYDHLFRFDGTASEFRVENYYVDAGGKPILANEQIVFASSPLGYPGMTPDKFKNEYKDTYIRYFNRNIAPARNAGGQSLVSISADGDNTSGIIAYSYTPGQRRVRLAPDFAYDSPIMEYAGIPLFDDVNIIYGKQDRFDHKLVGKKEVFIPYNNYDMRLADSEKVLTPKFPNPDLVRWELHRTWVVDMTVKPGFRHVSPKRRIYIDEDGFAGGAAESWDASGKLYKVGFNSTLQLWDVEQPESYYATYIDLARGIYALNLHMGKPTSRYLRVNITPLPNNNIWTPENLQMSGTR